MEWSVVGGKIKLGILLGLGWFFEVIVFEAECKLLTSVVVYGVKLVKHFAKARFDKIFPTVLLVSNKVRNGESLVAFGEEDAAVDGL